VHINPSGTALAARSMIKIAVQIGGYERRNGQCACLGA
jgi:hypothetical protein